MTLYGSDIVLSGDLILAGGELVIDGYVIDSQRLPRAYLASTQIQYVDSALGDDLNDGNFATPLATLGEAVARVPDGYSDVLRIQCQGAGPYTMPEKYPTMGSLGSLDIIADRSAPFVTNASPTFTVVPGKAAQTEDTSFGAHGGFADGYAWSEIDITIFGAPIIEAYPVLGVGASSTIRMIEGFTGTPTNIHQYSTRLNVESICTGWSGAANQFTGIRFIGFIVDFGSVVFNEHKAVNLSFRGCKFEGSCELINCIIGGYADSAVTAWEIVGSRTQSVTGGPIDFHWASSAPFGLTSRWGGLLQFRGLFEQTISVGSVSGSSHFIFSSCDFEKSSGTCIDSSFANLHINNSISFEFQDSATFGAARLIDASHLEILFAKDVVGSTSSTCVVLNKSCTTKNAALHLNGNLTNSTTPGNEIQVGTGAPIDSFSVLPVTDATTLCRAD